MVWTDVVTHPLGLVAFALALVFGVLGLKFKDRQKPWFFPTALALATIVIICGFILAYLSVEKSATVTQETHGPMSPAVQGVEGDVIIHQLQKEEQKK